MPDAYPCNDDVLQVQADFLQGDSELFALRIPRCPEQNNHQLVGLSISDLIQLIHCN